MTSKGLRWVDTFTTVWQLQCSQLLPGAHARVLGDLVQIWKGHSPASDLGARQIHQPGRKCNFNGTIYLKVPMTSQVPGDGKQWLDLILKESVSSLFSSFWNSFLWSVVITDGIPRIATKNNNKWEQHEWLMKTIYSRIYTMYLLQCGNNSLSLLCGQGLNWPGEIIRQCEDTVVVAGQLITSPVYQRMNKKIEDLSSTPSYKQSLVQSDIEPMKSIPRWYQRPFIGRGGSQVVLFQFSCSSSGTQDK